MNPANQNLDTQLDQLVDGELSPAEYRALLSALDDQPDGWRRCALAFLEAQALGQDVKSLSHLQPVAKPTAAVPGTAVANLPHEPPDDWSHRSWQGLYFATLAASLALAFYVGSWSSGWGARSSGDHFAATPPAGTADPGAVNEPGSSSADRKPPPSRPSAIAGNDKPLGNVRLVVDGDENSPGVEVPIYSPDQLDDLNLANQPVLPAHVIEQLRRAGHQIDHRQRYILLSTEDGRQVVVPVDDYQIQPSQRGAY